MKGYLACLAEEKIVPEVRAIVERSVEDGTLTGVLRFYEIRNEPMVREIIQAVAAAIDTQLAAECEDHTLGKTSFPRVHIQAVAFAFIAGAALAKEKKI